jgi:membrane protease YdiL (CAAX protease family)
MDLLRSDTPDRSGVWPAVGGRRVVVFVGLFFALWTGAWLINLAVADWWGSSLGGLAYWVVAKFLVWVVFPALFWGGRQVLTRAGLAHQAAFIGLRRDTVRQGLRLGLVATAIWIVLSLAVAAPGGIRIAGVGLVGVYTFLVTPVFEEVLFRGYIQSALIAHGLRFWVVNVTGAGLFLLAHCLGWAFEGVLGSNLLSTYPLSIILLSLVLGYVRHRSDSLLASILLHVGNNAFSTILKP